MSVIKGIKGLEARIFRIGTGLVVCGSLVALAVYGFGIGASFLAGGALGGLNLVWLRQTVNSAFAWNPSRLKARILAGFFLRLLLIPLSLYVMLRFLFLNVPAAVSGFAVFNCSIFVEGVLEAFGSRPK